MNLSQTIKYDLLTNCTRSAIICKKGEIMVNFEVPVNSNGKKLGAQKVDFGSQKDVIAISSKAVGSPRMEVDLNQKKLGLYFDPENQASLAKFQQDFPEIKPLEDGHFEFEISSVFMDAKENIELKIAGADTTFNVSANELTVTSGKQTSVVFSSNLNTPAPEFFDISFNENFLETLEFSRSSASKTPEEKLSIEFSSLPIQMFEKLKSSTSENVSTFSFGDGDKFKFARVGEQYFVARGDGFKPLPQNKLPVQDCVVYSEYEKDKFQVIFGMKTNENNEITDGIGLKNLSEEDIKSFKKFFNSENVKTKALGEQVIVAKQISSRKQTTKTADMTEEARVVFPEEMTAEEIIPEKQEPTFGLRPDTDNAGSDSSPAAGSNLPSVAVQERGLSTEVAEPSLDDNQETVPEATEEPEPEPAPISEANAANDKPEAVNNAPQAPQEPPKPDKKDDKKEPDFKGDALKIGMSLGKIAGAATIIASFAFPPLLFVGGLLYFGGFCSNDVVDTISTILKYCHTKKEYKKVVEKKEKKKTRPVKVDQKDAAKDASIAKPVITKAPDAKPEGTPVPVMEQSEEEAQASASEQDKSVSTIRQEVIDEELNLANIYEMFSVHTINDDIKKCITEYDKKVEEDLKACNAQLEKDPSNAELASEKQSLLKKKEFYDEYYREISKDIMDFANLDAKKMEALDKADEEYDTYHDAYSDYHIEQQKELEKKKAVREEALRHMKASREEIQKVKVENERQAAADAEERDKKMKAFEAEKANTAREELLKVQKLQAEQVEKLRVIKEKAMAFISALARVLGFDKSSDKKDDLER